MNRRRCTLATTLLTVAAALTLAPAALLANGRPPATFQVHDGPPGSDTLAVGATFGLLFTADGGESWRWACEQAMQPEPFSDPALVWRADGTLLQGTGNLLVSKDGGCSWSRHADFLDKGVMALEAHPEDDAQLFLGTGQGGGADGVWRSMDGGESWSPTPLSRVNTFFNAIEVAAADPQRVYVSAFDLAARAWLHRSDDGGETFTELEQLMPEPGAYRLLGSSPADADTVFAVFVARPTNRVQRSTDGGETFATVLELDEDVRQLAISADGQTVWLATALSLQRSTDGGQTFAPLAQPQTDACVARIGETLYACADPKLDPFALGASTDGGESWVPALTFERIVGPLECPADSPTASVCGERWEAERRVVAETWGVELPPEEDAGGDDCNCRTVRGVGQSSGGTVPAWLAVGLVGCLLLSGRRRQSPSRDDESLRKPRGPGVE